MLQLFLEIILVLSLFFLLHSYLLFPLIINTLAKNKSLNKNVYTIEDNLPFVSIIMAVRNADYVIQEKISSICNISFPANKIEFLIGSDASTDKTNNIIKKNIKQYPNIIFTEYPERKGKVEIINELSSKAKGEILLFTDADALPIKKSIFHIIKHFKNQDISIVCGNLQNNKNRETGVAIQENLYLKSEIKLKYNEGVLWGTLIGAYGAFFAIRKNEFEPVPKNFLVDDFFISFNAIQNGKKAILEPQAIIYENISGKIQDEFKRKIRISSGNFQNLKLFAPILFSKNRLLAFSFFSHKVLRWFGPIFILLIIISSVFLAKYGVLYQVFAAFLFFSLFIPIIDNLLRKFRINISILRFITHYYHMNLGLLIGFIKYLKGINTNIWEPTNRKPEHNN